MAHEMGHAVDPRFVVVGAYEYGQDGMDASLALAWRLH